MEKPLTGSRSQDVITLKSYGFTVLTKGDMHSYSAIFRDSRTLNLFPHILERN